jgi:dephospho-CoA kinase
MELDLVKIQSGIGLTGGIATGKSTVSDMIADAGYSVFDADRISREVAIPGSPGLKEIVGAFGAGVLNPDGTLNRPKLGEIVFSSAEKRQTLESITHPKIHARLVELLDRESLFDRPKLWFYEAALLFEKKRADKFFQIWVTFCSEETQMKRLMNRMGMTLAQAEKILKSQMPGEEKAAMADYAINTEVPIEKVKEQVSILLREAENAFQKKLAKS